MINIERRLKSKQRAEVRLGDWEHNVVGAQWPQALPHVSCTLTCPKLKSPDCICPSHPAGGIPARHAARPKQGEQRSSESPLVISSRAESRANEVARRAFHTPGH